MLIASAAIPSASRDPCRATSGTAFTLTTMGRAARNDAIGYFCVGN
jgi:hypothetical protein